MENTKVIIEDKNQMQQTFTLGETVYVVAPECIVTQNKRLRQRNMVVKVHEGRLEDVYVNRYGIEMMVTTYPVKGDTEHYCYAQYELGKNVFRNRADAELAAAKV